MLDAIGPTAIRSAIGKRSGLINGHCQTLAVPSVTGRKAVYRNPYHR